MNNDRIEIQHENTISDVRSNLKKLNIESTKLEQCLLAVSTLVSYEETKESAADLTAILQDQAEDINTLIGFIRNQVERINIE